MIHILKHGAAMCGQPGTPGSWPEGHKWVSFEDSDVAVTCPDCKHARMRELNKMAGPLPTFKVDDRCEVLYDGKWWAGTIHEMRPQNGGYLVRVNPTPAGMPAIGGFGYREVRRPLCPRCGKGNDTDGDGNCHICARLTDAEIEQRFGPKEAT